MMQLNRIYNSHLDRSSLLLLNDDVDFEVRTKVNKVVADQYPDIEKPTKERLWGYGSRLNRTFQFDMEV